MTDKEMDLQIGELVREYKSKERELVHLRESGIRRCQRIQKVHDWLKAYLNEESDADDRLELNGTIQKELAQFSESMIFHEVNELIEKIKSVEHELVALTTRKQKLGI